VPKVAAEFSNVEYMSDIQLSRLKRISLVS